MTSSTSNNIFYSSPLHILDYDEEQIGPYAVQPSTRILGPSTPSYPVRSGEGEYEQKAPSGDQAHRRPESENTISIPSIYGGGELPLFGLQYTTAPVSLYENRSNDGNSQQAGKLTLMQTTSQNGDTDIQGAYTASMNSAGHDAGIESRYVALRCRPSVYIASNYFDAL